MKKKIFTCRPRETLIMGFGQYHIRSCEISLRRNSRWKAYRQKKDVWVVSCEKIVIKLTNSNFRRLFEKIQEEGD